LNILQRLLAAGADPNQPDEDGTTAYVLARRLANKEASALLEAHGANRIFTVYDAILIAAADGDTETVQRLAKDHPDVLAAFTDHGRQENDGFSLGSSGQILHDLARLGHLAALTALLDLGMDPGLTNPQNETPLHWACVAGRPEAAKLLIERGAPLDVREKSYNCIPAEWIYWGSEYWSEPHGDYGTTAEILLNAGSPLPEKAYGSKEVRAVLAAHGLQP
jgi:ankyrin repeat protein